MDDTKQAIAPVVMDKPVFSVLLKPVATNDQILEAWRNYQDLKVRLLDKDDFCEVGGKKYACKSAHRKLALAFGVSVEIVDEKRLEVGSSVTYEITAKATSPNGRSMSAMGVCSSDERRQMKYADVKAISQTRATNRAISDLLGGILGTSLEELDLSNPEPQYEPFKQETARPRENNATQVFTDLFNNHRQDEVAVEDMASDKQKGLIRHLVETKISGESEEQYYLGRLDQVSKLEASNMIKALLGI